MFQPATTAIVWAAYCLLRAWETDHTGRRLGWWLGLALALEFALYSYLFSAFVLPAAGVTLIALVMQPVVKRQTSNVKRQTSNVGGQALRWRRFFEGATALAVVGLLFVPLAYSAWTVNSAEGAPGRAFAHVGQNLWRLLRVFTIWRVDWPLVLHIAALTLFGLLALLGLLLPRLAGNTRSSAQSTSSVSYLDRLWLVFWIGLPLLIGNLLLARSDSVFAEDRYFLFLAPFVLWAIARGCVTLGQHVGGAGLVAGIVAPGLLIAALPHLWTPAMYREQWRAAADYMVSYQQASPTLPAAIVAHIDYTRRPLERYLRPILQANEVAFYFPFGGVLSAEHMETEIAPKLRGIVDLNFATLWLTQSHLEGVDDDHLVEAWLNQHFPLVTEQYPTGIKLSGYALQSRFDALPPLAEEAMHTAVEVAPGVQLAACEIINPVLSAQDDSLHPPSGWVHLRLWWQATGPIGDDYMATAQMVGPEGVWGERLYRENEALRRWPTSAWQPGDVVRDEVDVNLNPATPQGEYPILTGLMDSTGQPMDRRVECGRVRITG
jgi:hypothetical protein